MKIKLNEEVINTDFEQIPTLITKISLTHDMLVREYYVFEVMNEGVYKYKKIEGVHTIYEILGHRNLWINRADNPDTVQAPVRPSSIDASCVEEDNFQNDQFNRGNM